jgi:hypothetical protein
VIRGRVMRWELKGVFRRINCNTGLAFFVFSHHFRYNSLMCDVCFGPVISAVFFSHIAKTRKASGTPPLKKLATAEIT